MNKQGKGKIEWCDWTINPVKGKCLHKCSYCYANAIHDRFKWDPKVRFEPKILEQIVKAKKPSKIFIGSMHDLFGDWIRKEWIEQIIKTTKKYPLHTFIFLTKNPRRYLEFDFPKNCWLGVTVDGIENDMDRTYKIDNLVSKKDNYRFVSFEPLLGDVSDVMWKINVNSVHLVIIGGLSGPKPFYPPQEWIDNIIKQCKKNNIEIIFKRNLYAQKRI